MIQLTMMKFLRSMCERIGNRCVRLGKSFYMHPIEKRVIPWVRGRGDQTLRLDYSLCSDSVVFDVGGYEGSWSSDIFSKFCCHVHVFEPVPEFGENIKKRFALNRKIIVHAFGLADKTTVAEIVLDSDGSSIYKTNAGKNIATQSVKLVNIKDFMRDNMITHIDLIKINIEGGEYG